jgi:hypothetical protein
LRLCSVFAKELRLLVAIVVAVVVPIELRCYYEGRTISVVVHDVAGSVVLGARARLLSVDRVLQVDAEANGEMQFKGTVPGKYDLEVSASGFRKRIYRDLVISSSDSMPIDVVLGVGIQPDHCGYLNTLEYVTVKPEAKIFSGHVIDEDSGKGVGSVRIDLSNAGEGTMARSITSDRSGNFSFLDLPPGRYSVHAFKNGYWPTELEQFLVPRENLAILHLGLDKKGHLHICE